LQNNRYYDLHIKYQPDEQDTLFARYNLWDHVGLDEILANDLLNEGNENLVIELGGFITFPNIPGLIFPVNNATSDTLNIELSWWQTAIPDRYHLQLATDNNFTAIVIDTTNLNDTSLFITLEPETVYYWRVQAVNPAGESDWSEIWQFTTDIAGFRENEKEPVSVEIFPNPASGTFTIHSEIFSQEPVNIYIIDLNGKILIEKNIPTGTNEIILDTNELNNGIYLCHIRTQEYSLVRKIIIQK
ncbi:MAG: T9SS type A sorting domain-containing protein, partial [Bacteroidales bacterium]|nr:T9SS type A sorting domain-containing protein [Bacteroidales bacterium]